MLFKILHGDESRISTDITPFHEGWAYVTHSGNFYVDMNVGTVEDPNYQRVKLNAKDAETISGLSLDALESLVSANAAIVLAESQNYTNTAISELHIENGRGEGSIQQVADTSGEDGVFVGEDGIEYIKLSATVHPEAPHKEGDFIPFGATGHYAKSFSGKSSAQGWRSTADGTGAIASGDYAYAHGDSAVAAGKCARAEGSGTYAKGYYSHASGQGSMAEGAISTAEGKNTRAGGQASHAEGVDTTAGGNNSHAEGETTKASGRTSHAEGRDTEAKGYYAHTEGRGTIARTRSQHAEGEYNIADPKWTADARGKYIHIAGNGTSSAPSNAHTLDWDGNAWFAGGIYVGGTNQDDAKDIVGAIDELDAKIEEISAKDNEAISEAALDDLKILLTAQDAIVISESQSYTDTVVNEMQNYTENAISEIQSYTDNAISELNIVKGSGEGSLQQAADTSGSNGVYTGEDGKEYFTVPSTVHPDAPYKEGDVIQHGAIGTYSKAFGGKSSAQGKSSATDGTVTIAAGDYSHAEGNTTVASGEASHSEGISTYAKGKYSHAEGNKTSATGNATHAEGGDTVASGNYSHAEGRGTVARTRSQHVEGEYNKEDPKNKANERGKYAHITGNGKSGALSNAYTLDWSGNAWFAGNVYVGGEDQDNGAVTLQTTVDNRLETDSKNVIEAINEIDSKTVDKMKTIETGNYCTYASAGTGLGVGYLTTFETDFGSGTIYNNIPIIAGENITFEDSEFGENGEHKIVKINASGGGVNYSQGLDFTPNGDGTCYVSGIGSCTDSDIVIPPTYQNYTVTEVGEQAFRNATITSVTIPDSVTTIRFGAFGYVGGDFHALVIPSSVTIVEDYIIHSCGYLTVYCEAESQPSTWNANWNIGNRPVVWGYTDDFIDLNKKISDLETASKKNASDIDDIGGKTIDKIAEIDTWVNGEASSLNTNDGVSWEEGVEFFDDQGGTLAAGTIYHRIPIEAGDNVTFSNEGDVVKINASGGVPSATSSNAGQVLTVNSRGTPVWAAPSSSGGSSGFPSEYFPMYAQALATPRVVAKADNQLLYSIDIYDDWDSVFNGLNFDELCSFAVTSTSDTFELEISNKTIFYLDIYVEVVGYNRDSGEETRVVESIVVYPDEGDGIYVQNQTNEAMDVWEYEILGVRFKLNDN